MSSFNVIFVLCLMLAVSQAREKTKCEIEHNITDADMEELKKLNLSDRLTCFAKCAMNASGSINSEGEINVDKLNHAIKRWIKLSEEESDSVNECVKTLAPVKTCSDVRHITTCVKNRKVHPVAE